MDENASDVPTDLGSAEVSLKNAVYAATSLFEALEHAGLVRGNGHHMRQEASERGVDLLRQRWIGAKDA